MMFYLASLSNFTLIAILICMENSFWNQHTSSNFLDWFKNSFTSYVDSEMGKKMEVDIDSMLGGEQGVYQVDNEFKEKLYKIVMDHYLCKFYCLYSHSNHLTTGNTAHSNDETVA